MTKRVLLDESVPRHLANALDAAGFPTTNICAQQNLRGRKLAVVVLPTNRRRDIMQRASDIVDTVRRIMPGQHVVIEITGQRPIIDYTAPGGASDEMPVVDAFKIK